MKSTVQICGVALVFSLFCVNVGTSQPDEQTRRRIEQVKKGTDFANWGPETGRVISGVAISEKTLPQLQPLRKVWPQDDFRLEPTKEATYASVRQWWRGEGSQFEVTMVVGPSFTAAKDYLLMRYVETTREPPLIKAQGRDFGLKIGNVCLVTTETEGKTFSSIDFIRDNVVVVMTAEGNFRSHLRDVAQGLDTALREKRPTKEYAQRPDRPSITAFSLRETTVRLGATVPLQLQVRDPSESGTHYFWTITGGGVKRDLAEGFIYQATETGKQRITITVVNGVGLYASKSVDVEVVP